MPSIDVLSDGDMAKRLTVTVDDDLYAVLEEIAEDQQRTVANLLAFLGAQAAKEWQQQKSQDKSK